MWLSRQQKREKEEQAAESGLVTISGETVAVELDSERRGLTVYGPGGYEWRPAAGERVLVIQTREGLCVVGKPCGARLEAGEVGLTAPGGAAVTLKRDGRVLLSGGVEVDGKKIYLCMTAGDDAETLLNLLDQYRSQAAFFCTPEFMEIQGSLLRRMTATGHAIGILVDAGDP